MYHPTASLLCLLLFVACDSGRDGIHQSLGILCKSMIHSMHLLEDGECPLCKWESCGAILSVLKPMLPVWQQSLDSVVQVIVLQWRVPSQRVRGCGWGPIVMMCKSKVVKCDSSVWMVWSISLFDVSQEIFKEWDGF